MPTTFYLRNVTAANPPTAGEKSTALPVDTLGANNAGGTDETRSLDTAKGAAQTSLAKNSDASTAARDNYLCRFTSAALAAQTIAAATWTLAIALSEGNTNANSFFVGSVYIWRPSTNSVVGFIYDSHTNVGVEWAAGEDGQVLSLVGSAVTTLLNDVLVIEIWRHAVQGMAAAYAQTVYFDGTTDVIDSTTSDAASFLRNPNVITFGSQTFTQTLATTEIGVATLTRITTFLRSLAATELSIPSLTTLSTFLRSLIVIELSVLTLTPVTTFLRTLAATELGVAVLSAASIFSKTLSAIETGIASLTLVKLLTLAMSAVSTSVTTISRVVTYLRTLAAASVSVPTFSNKFVILRGRPFLFTSANWGATVIFNMEVFIRSTSGTAEVELYNVTDGIIVTGSNVSTASASFVRLRSGTITLTDGKEYRLQLKREASGGGAILGGHLIAI